MQFSHLRSRFSVLQNTLSLSRTIYYILYTAIVPKVILLLHVVKFILASHLGFMGIVFLYSNFNNNNLFYQ